MDGANKKKCHGKNDGDTMEKKRARDRKLNEEHTPNTNNYAKLKHAHKHRTKIMKQMYYK